MSDHIPDAGKMVSDTPRTDAAHIGMGIVPRDFAQQLERELNAANERIKRLEEAGDATANLLLKGDLNDHTALLHTYSMWIKTKEAKP